LAFFSTSALIGAGLVGPQIAVVLAQGCDEVRVFDQDPISVARALDDMRAYVDELDRHSMLRGGSADAVYGRIRAAKSLDEACERADFIIEAIFENVEAKQTLFAELGRIAPPTAIIGSNTSTIPIRHMAESCAHPERVIGTHFVLPAHILPLVEVVKHPQVDDRYIQTARDALTTMGKVPIVVNVDIPGFVNNRLQHSLTRQAIELLVNGVASAEDIDNAVRFGFGARFTSLGPLSGRDISGIVNHSKVASYLYHDLDGKGDLAVRTLREMAEKGHDGLRTLQGFHEWRGDPAALRSFHYEQMIDQTKRALAVGTVKVEL